MLKPRFIWYSTYWHIESKSYDFQAPRNFKDSNSEIKKLIQKLEIGGDRFPYFELLLIDFVH